MASCKDCKFPCKYQGFDETPYIWTSCAAEYLEAMKDERADNQAIQYDVTLLQSFEWEGDVLTRTLAERIGEDSGIHVLDHYQTDFTELREFLDAKRKGLELRPVVRGKWIDEPIKGIRYHCSVCQGRFDYTWHFCPNCGAKMEG